MLRAQVLGQAAQDNALWVTADSGSSVARLLLDCGAGTLAALPFAELQAVDHLLFSHLHMDHVGGFDDFFRATFDRTGRENHIWGPPGTARILSHRFQGFWWNFAPDLRGTWLVHDILEHEVQTFRFEAHEAFAVRHDAGTRPHTGVVLTLPELSVQAAELQHHGTSLGFILREPERVNVAPDRLRDLDLKGGPWLSQLKSGATGDLDVNGVLYDAAELRASLLRREPGDSLAYLTDFLLDESELARLGPLLGNVQTLYAEAQYAPEDADLAQKNHHTTVQQVAQLAQQARVGRLELLHLSRRYRPENWAQWLEAAQRIFPDTTFPAPWSEQVSTSMPEEMNAAPHP